MDAETLRQYLEFYRDLGFKTLYRQQAVASPETPAAELVREPLPAAALVPRTPPLPQPPPTTAMELPPLAPKDDTLLKIMADIGDCRRCRLCEARNKIVFGVGNEKSPIVFVGEGPGAEEDAQGIPFVGRAGQLLTQMIEGTAKKEGIPLQRDDVYIANVVKCRPPENRTPESDEMEICGQFLHRQLQVIRPKAICALGGTAARAMTGQKEGVTKLRGKWFKWQDIPVMVTYHPSYLLRAYNTGPKREAWEDLKRLLHFVYD
ncbi:MAG: uracil-DNA glycosylase [Candidatus Solibacter sp.]